MKLRFFIYFSFFLLLTAVRDCNAYALSKVDRTFLSKATCGYLQAWCPDAWCAGDFQHEWQSFYFDEIKSVWVLDFVTFVRFREALRSPRVKLRSSYQAAAGWQIDVESQENRGVRSQCFFPDPEPRAAGVFGPVALGLDAGGELDYAKPLHLTERGSQQLVGCTAKVESYLRALLNKPGKEASRKTGLFASY